jgi:hypothetical protein
MFSKFVKNAAIINMAISSTGLMVQLFVLNYSQQKLNSRFDQIIRDVKK